MISVVYSTEHLLMPKIIGTLLVIMLAVSLIFGVAFNITLPSGICSITFIDYGITIY